MSKFRHVAGGAVSVLMAGALAVTGLFANSASAADATITVSNTATGTISTQLSTNNVWSGMLDQYPNAVSNYNKLALPLVRLHVGDDGSPAAMPEIQQGQWSFKALDTLVNDETSQQRDVVMNIKFAPDWMWSCYPNSIGVKGTQGTGSVVDTTFQTFAQYMARLVSYYNKGSMTTESGTVITNPKGTANHVTWWELWNEPDLNNETPCAPSNGLGLSPAQYVTMWNAVTAAMLKVDPNLKFVGPATAGGQFGSSTGVQNDYITQLMSGGTVKPSALSFHGYGYWDNSVPDKWLFDGDGTQGGGGITDIKSAATLIHATYPGMPIWITEVNVNAAWGNDPYSRPWTQLGAAWWASMFSQLAPLGVQMIHQYEVMESPQFGLLDDTNGNPRLPYWTEQVLNSAFPSGSTLLSASSSNSQVQTLAAQRADGTYTVLVANRQLDSSTMKGGPGQPANVTVQLNGITPGSVSVQQIDATTSATAGPATVSLSPSSTLSVSLPGYGFAVLTITPTSGTPAPSPTPTATATASPTPTATATASPSPTATATASPTPTSTATATPTPTTTSTGAPAPMTVISRGVRAYANNTCSGSYPAKLANDGDYGTTWQACGAPSTTSPRRLTYDLSSVSAARRGKVLVSWYNDPITSEYNHVLDGGVGYNIPKDYTIQLNSAPGGTQPSSGWVTAATVTGNTYHSRQQLIDMTGYNWIRLSVTASDGSSGNYGVALNMDVQDASAGPQDAWAFYGDSITQDGMAHDDRTASNGATVGTFGQLVNAGNPTYFPAQEDAGVEGFLSANGAGNIGTWLSMFKGRYVVLAYGTNDANNASAGDSTIAATFRNNLTSMVQAVLAAGKVPVIPTIPWGRTKALQANVPVLNQQVGAVLASYPQAIAGPDLYSFFNANQSLISTDNIHPTWGAGYAAYRQQWASWALNHIYG